MLKQVQHDTDKRSNTTYSVNAYHKTLNLLCQLAISVSKYCRYFSSLVFDYSPSKEKLGDSLEEKMFSIMPFHFDL